MGASYAARERGTSTAGAPEGQQQQEQQGSSRRRNKCSEYAPSIEYIYFVLRVLE